MTPKQEQKLNEVYETIQMLKNAASIPYEFDAAFRDRFGLRNAATRLIVSSKSANSEDQSVDEAGANSYIVLGDPVGFLEVDIEGTTYCLPYYNV